MVNVTATAEEGTAKTSAKGWSGTTTSQSGQTYNDAVQTASQAGRQISGGSISMGVQIKNTGLISYDLTDLTVTALQHRPELNSFTAVASLQLANPLGAGLSFGGIGSQLLAAGGGIALAPGEATGILQVKADLAGGNKVLDLMANPASLYFDIGTFAITNAQNVDFSFIDQVTDGQTGVVLIDFGGGTVISKRVATNVNHVGGEIVGITLREVLTTLEIIYQTESRTIDNQTIAVLTGVQNPETGEMVSVDTTNNRFWVTLKSAQAFAPLVQNFDDVILQAGGATYLLYVTDGDQDGVYLRDENLYGSSDAKADSDGDGLSDFEEIATGWQVAATLPPRYPVQVFSNPMVPDSDNDGLSDAQEKAAGTDPNNPDTDNDLLCDGPGSSANASSMCTAGATPDPQPLVPRFAFIGSSPAPYAFNAPAGAPIVVNFSVPVRGTSTFEVRSETRGAVKQKGPIASSNGGRTLTFTPEQPFMPNEVIHVSLTGETSVDSGKLLPDYHYDFSVAAPASAGLGAASSQLVVSSDPGYIITDAVSGDFNQDGVLDVAVAGVNRSVSGVDSVNVVFGTGAGDFIPGATVGFPSVGLQGLVAGDFNNDGRLDLAVTAVKNASVAVLLAGATQGQFATPTYVPVGDSPVAIATGDLNGDGNLDLVSVNNGDGGNSILLGKGDGTFAAGQPLSSGLAPQTVAVADIDGDGFLDTITTFGSSPGTGGVTIRLGNGDGSFRDTGSAQPFTSAGFPMAIATADFNGDGLLDFVTANQGADDMTLFINQGKGMFAPQANIPVPHFPTGITAGDFNGDGKMDIAVSAFSSPNSGMVFYGTANIDSFEQQVPMTNTGFQGTAIVADWFSDSVDVPVSFVLLGTGASSPWQLGVFQQLKAK